MNEKNTYLEEVDQTNKNEKELSHNWFLRSAIITWATISTMFLNTSCDLWTKDPIKQQARVDRQEMEVAGISFELHTKINNRINDVAEYNRLLAQCKADPDNRSLQNYTMLQWEKILKENKEIERLARKKLRKTKRLDDRISKTQYWLLEWRPLTDENYYNFLVLGN